MEEQLDGLNDAEEQLRKLFYDTQKEERSFIDKMIKKYGDGTLNPETGEFIPTK